MAHSNILRRVMNCNIYAVSQCHDKKETFSHGFYWISLLKSKPWPSMQSMKIFPRFSWAVIAWENSQIALMTEVSYHQQSANKKRLHKIQWVRNTSLPQDFAQPFFPYGLFMNMFDGLSKREIFTNCQQTCQRNLSHV